MTELPKPRIESSGIDNQFMLARLAQRGIRRCINGDDGHCWRRRGSGVGGRLARLPGGNCIQILERGIELVAPVQIAQGIAVGFAQDKVTHADIERDIGLDRYQIARQRQMAKRLAQIFSDLAADGGGIPDHPIQRSVLGKPLGRRFRSAFGHSRHVVHRVAGEGEKIHNALRWHAEFVDDRLPVHRRARHRVDQADMRRDELGKILVAGGDDHLDVQRFSLACQGANHIVGFDTANAQDGKAEGGDDFQHRLHLRLEVVRRWRAIGLVLGIHLVTKRRPRGIADKSNKIRLFLQGRAQHVDHAEQCAGRLAGSIAQGRQGMECTEQVGRSVNQDKALA